jgi:hypothetical protein
MMYGSRTERITFQVVKLPASKSGKCPVCGKRVTRRMTFEATLNPWNVNASGAPKSRSEIYQDLQARAKEWMAKPIADHCDPSEVVG